MGVNPDREKSTILHYPHNRVVKLSGHTVRAKKLWETHSDPPKVHIVRQPCRAAGVGGWGLTDGRRG